MLQLMHPLLRSGSVLCSSVYLSVPYRLVSQKSSGGARVFVAHGKRVCYRPHQSDQFCNQGIFQDFGHRHFRPNLKVPAIPARFVCPSHTAIRHLYTPPLEMHSLKSTFKVWERSKRGLGRSPSRNWIWCILALKSNIWLLQILIFSWESNDQISCRILKFYAEFGNTWIVRYKTLKYDCQ